MPLILTRDLNGKGNGITAENRAVRINRKTGEALEEGDALVLHTAKANGLVFKPWEIVQCPGGKLQEDKVHSYCAGAWSAGSSPIQRWSWQDSELVKEYMKRHPEDRPKADAGTDKYLEEIASLVASTEDPKTGPSRRVDQGPNIRTMDSADMAKMTPSGTKLRVGKPTRSTVQQDASPVQEHAAGVWQDTYNKHVEAGKTEKQAANYADRKAKGSMRRGETEASA